MMIKKETPSTAGVREISAGHHGLLQATTTGPNFEEAHAPQHDNSTNALLSSAHSANILSGTQNRY